MANSKNNASNKKRSVGISIEDFGVQWVGGFCGNFVTIFAGFFLCVYEMGMKIEILFSRQPCRILISWN